MSGVFTIFEAPVSTVTASSPKTFGSSKISLHAYVSGTGTYSAKYVIDVSNFATPTESQWILNATDEDEVTNLKQSSGFGFLEQAWLSYRVRVTAITGTATFQVYGREQ